ncbi:MAG TPA: hypothetical protein VMJ92_01900 [Candidatus Limnocylindrales bacterium]|nr:hypothetical protein [Candidatus Limnocylindrales bacterium]
MQRSRHIAARPLSPADYDVPVGWWGWNWEPPVPMSVVELLDAGNLDERTAALCWLVLESHGSLLIAAEQPHSGKTTTLTSFLDFVPDDVRRIFIRGWAETFDYLRQTDPATTLLLANELSSHLPVYLWGPKTVEVFRGLRRGYAIASTLHADSAEETVAQLRDELGVEAADLARVDLLLVMRIFRVAGSAALARRVVGVHRFVADPPGVEVRTVPLVTWDAAADRHGHDEAAELELLRRRRGGTADGIRRELDRRAAHLAGLRARGVRSIPAVRAAIGELRGERDAHGARGDATA